MSTIYHEYVTDNAGQQYRVAISYQKDGRPRGYYVSIIPCNLENVGNGIFSCTTEPVKAILDRTSVYSCIEQVTRASKAAAARAMDQLETIKDIYFAPRGIAFTGGAWETIQYHENPETMQALRAVFPRSN